jgi:hypothetical protein
MVDQVIERLPLDADTQLVHRGEIGGAQPARFVDLAEEHFLGRTAARTPAADMPLQGAQLAVGEAAGMAALQLLEDRLGLKPGVDVEEFAHRAPDLLEGVRPGAPSVGRGDFAGPLAQAPVFACCLLIHVRPPRRLDQRSAVSQQAKQPLDLLVRDHRNPPCARKLRSPYGHPRPGKSNCRRPTPVIVVGADR